MAAREQAKPGQHARRTDGRFKAAIQIGIHPDGRPKYKYVYATSQRALAAKVDEVRLAVKLGTPFTPDRITVRELMQIWNDKHVARLAENTREQYQYCATEINRVLGNVRVKALSPLMIITLLDSMTARGLSGTTIRHTYDTLRTAYNRAVMWRLAPPDNPCSGVEPPKRDTKKRKPYTREEALRLMEFSKGTIMYPLVVMAISTGLREGELLALQWDDIDWQRCWLHVDRALIKTQDGAPVFGPPKTEDSERDIPLGPTIMEVLKAHRSHQQVIQRLNAGPKWKDFGLIFTNRHGGPLNDSNLRCRYWYPLLEKAGLRRIHVHDCRHTFGTFLMTDLGTDVKSVQEMMGHGDGNMTINLYGHGRSDAKEKAARLLADYLTASTKETLSD